MTKFKLDQLIKKGWVSGDTKDFLNLSEEESNKVDYIIDLEKKEKDSIEILNKTIH